MSTDVDRIPKKMEGPGDDFRPPWVYLGSRLISFLVIPSTFSARYGMCLTSRELRNEGVAFYAVFFYDFGDHEHVFQAVS